jgi:hypothetical protein
MKEIVMSDANRGTRVKQVEVTRPGDPEARRVEQDQITEESGEKAQTPRWINLNHYFSPLPNIAGCIVGFIMAIVVLFIIFIMGGHVII